MISTTTSRLAQLKYPHQALVVGGGITGLTTALLLRRAGIGAHVVEKASHVEDISGLYVICPAALSKLDLQFPGVGGLITDKYSPVALLKTFQHTEASVRGLDFGGLYKHALVPSTDNADAREGQARFTPLGIYAIPASDLRCLIEEGFWENQGKNPGHDTSDVTEWGVSLVNHVQDWEGINVELSNGDHRRYDFLIGADGDRSAVSRTMEHGVARELTGFVGWSGDCSVHHDPDSDSLFTPGDVCVFSECREQRLIATFHCPVSQRLYWSASIFHPQLARTIDEQLKQSVDVANTFSSINKHELLRNLPGWGANILKIVEDTSHENLHTRVFHHPDLRNTWADDRVFLVGQAARASTPFDFIADTHLDDAFWAASALSLTNFSPREAAEAYVEHRTEVSAEAMGFFAKLQKTLLSERSRLDQPTLADRWSNWGVVSQMLTANFDPIFHSVDTMCDIWALSSRETSASRGQADPLSYRRLDQDPDRPHDKDFSLHEGSKRSVHPRRLRAK